jgi:acylpyruvate hydrolase
VLNDVTARDWQYRSTQWLQGKTFERTAPFGPVLVTADELDPDSGLELAAELDGEIVQRASTADLLFKAVDLVCYISAILPLRPGDVIATGTPGGVGHAHEPPRYLRDGVRVTTRITGIGEMTNVARASS